MFKLLPKLGPVCCSTKRVSADRWILGDLEHYLFLPSRIVHEANIGLTIKPMISW